MKYINDYYKSLLFSSYFAYRLSKPLLYSVKAYLSKVKNTPADEDRRLTLIFGEEFNLNSLVTILNLTSSSCVTEKWSRGTFSSLNCV